MNVFTFTGRCGADAELRKTQSGESVLSVRVCNTVGFGDRKVDQWIDVSLWGKRGEAIADYVKRGDKIGVSGEVKLETFQRRDGTEGSKLAVRANDIELDSNKRDGGGQSEARGNRDDDRGNSRGGYSNDRGGRGGGGGRDYGDRDSRGGSGGRSGGKPAFDQDLDDEIPFLTD